MPSVTLRQLKALVARNPGRRILGLDVGTLYVGVAISDAQCRVASPLSVVGRTQKGMPPNPTVVTLPQLLSSARPLALVIGFPLEIHGTHSLMTVRTGQFVRSEIQACDALSLLPHLLWDERYSSQAAS